MNSFSSEEMTSVQLAGGAVLFVPAGLAPADRHSKRRESAPAECDCEICRQQDHLPARLHGIPGARQLAMPYPAFNHVWFWLARLPERKGQCCAVLARGRMNSILVQFQDGFRVVTSRHAVRRLRPPTAPVQDRDTSRAVAPGNASAPECAVPEAVTEPEAPALPLRI